MIVVVGSVRASVGLPALVSLASLLVGAGTASASEGHGGYPGLGGDLALWSFVAFLGFVLAIKKLGLWDLLLNSMADREKAERDAITQAETDLAAAQEILSESRGRVQSLDETVREILAEAERDAAHTKESVLAAARAEAEQIEQRTRIAIDRVRDQSLVEIFDTLVDRVSETTEQVLKDRLTPEDQARLIDETLGQLAEA